VSLRLVLAASVACAVLPLPLPLPLPTSSAVRLPVVASPGSVAASVTTAPTAADTRVLPPVNAAADYQLGGGYTPARGIRIVTRDVTERPASGTYGICYVNAFQTQPGTASWWLRAHRNLVLRTASGVIVRDPGWPDEMLLDTSTPAKRAALAAIVGMWLSRCARAGYRAVEPDNLDSWTRSRGRLTMRMNAAFAALVVRRAHTLGLAVAQKNDTDMLALHASTGFDFAVAEECQVYAECAAYQRVYGRHLIEIEYADAGGRPNFRAACRARGTAVTIVYRDRDLVPRGRPGYVFATC
jgi:hypothetical protein